MKRIKKSDGIKLLAKDKTQKIELCNLLRKADPSLSIRDISKITKIPATSVSRYLQNGGILNE